MQKADIHLKIECFKQILQFVPRLNSSLLCDHFNMICKLACASSDKLQTHPHLPSSSASVFTLPLLRLLLETRMADLSSAPFPFPLQCVPFLPAGCDGLPSSDFPSESSLPLCFLLTSLSFRQLNEKAKKWKQ